MAAGAISVRKGSFQRKYFAVNWLIMQQRIPDKPDC